MKYISMLCVLFMSMATTIHGITDAIAAKISARMELQKMINVIYLELLKAQEAGNTEKIAHALSLIEAAKRKMEELSRYDDVQTNNQQCLHDNQPIRISLSKGPREYNDFDKSQKIVLLVGGIVAGVSILIPLLIMEWKFMLEFLGMNLTR